jgi:hypothetical protein
MMKQPTEDFTIGADPEAFCEKDQQLIAVQNCGIQGTKEKPQWLPAGSNVQRDNALIEFAIPPAKGKVQFVQHIGDALMDVMDVLPDGVDIKIIPSAHFPLAQLTHEECKEFGCSPDMNAWTRKKNDPPGDAAEGTFRSAGGHIHVGYIKGSDNIFLLDQDGKLMTICMMDSMHGLVSTVLDSSPEAIARRTLYGKAGCCRLTDYGVEYRTLSNFWIKSPSLVELMYGLTEDVLKIMREKTFMNIIRELGAQNIQRVITEGMSGMAADMIKAVTQEYMSDESIALFYTAWGGSSDINFKEAWKEIL